MKNKSPYHLTLDNFLQFVHQQSKYRKGDFPNALKEKAEDVWMKTNSRFPLFNGIFRFSGCELSMRQMISDSKMYFSQCPFAYWHMKPDEEIDDRIKELFANADMQSGGTYTGAMLKLSEYSYPKPSDPEVRIRKVETVEDYKQFMHLLFEVFPLGEEMQQEFMEMYDPFPKDSNLIHYMLEKNGELCCILSTFEYDGVIGVYNGATPVRFRKKGYFGDILHYCLKELKEEGYEAVVGQLMGKNMAGRVMADAGFETVCYFTPYIHGQAVEEE